jgi:hypothetical protein
VRPTRAGSWPNVPVSGFAAQQNSSAPRRSDNAVQKILPTGTGARCRMTPSSRVLGRGRRRAWSVAGEQTENTATTLAKRRRNGRACGREYLCSAICACWVIRLGRVAHTATRGSVQAMARSPGGGNPDQSARRGKSSTQSLACALWVMAERQLDTLISSSPWNFETFPRSRG